jgi:uncharacterized protein (TIGR03435 family)
LAYDTFIFGRIVGIPPWADLERYDISAKTEAPLNDLRILLRTLLRDRFTFRAHTETRAAPAFLLTLARPNQPLGPKLQPTTVNCDDAEAVRKARETKPAGAPLCGGVSGRNRIWMSGMRISTLANAIASLLDRPVVDRTGLTGRFDFDLEYTATSDLANLADAADRVSIFTAIQEQLGLRLQAEDVPLEVLVIDAIERPTEN